MKKTVMTSILSLAFLLVILGFVSIPAQAKSKDFWVSGYGGGMELKKKQMKAVYNGNVLKISGYGRKTSPVKGYGKTKKLKARSKKNKKNCKVAVAGYETSYKTFLKEEGRKGRLEAFIDIHVKNNKIVYIDYGF